MLAVLVVIVCVGGTYWQVVRSFEPDRETITNPVEDLATAERLVDHFEPGEYLHPDRIANSAVEVSGHYDGDAQLLVPRADEEGTPGFDVIVPLVIEDDIAIAVNRGWTEDEQDPPAVPGGEVTVTGWLLPAQDAADGVVPVEVPEGQVERIAPSVLINEWDLRLYEGYITLPEQDPATDSLTPVPPPEPPTEFTVNWRSLSYTVQWAMFGASAVVFWIILVRRELKEARSRRGGVSEQGDGESSQPVATGS